MPQTKLFPALLKYWRGVRGMSQLDLASAADVSSRHLSFLETGRAKPSEQMVFRLSATLNIPMREQNALLVAAGFPTAFADGGSEDLAPHLRHALERMMQKQEPYPLIVMDKRYDLIMTNGANLRVMSKILDQQADAIADRETTNVLRMTFSDDGLKPAIANWDAVARHLLIRLQREVLQNPADEKLIDLLEELVEMPGVPSDWRAPDLGLASEPTLNLRLRCDGQDLTFLTTLTVFNAPQNVTLEELRIESYFPLDSFTERVCSDLASRDTGAIRSPSSSTR